MRKILVVGGTGFIGKHLVKHCVQKNLLHLVCLPKKLIKKIK